MPRILIENAYIYRRPFSPGNPGGRRPVSFNELWQGYPAGVSIATQSSGVYTESSTPTGVATTDVVITAGKATNTLAGAGARYFWRSAFNRLDVTKPYTCSATINVPLSGAGTFTNRLLFEAANPTGGNRQGYEVTCQFVFGAPGGLLLSVDSSDVARTPFNVNNPGQVDGAVANVGTYTFTVTAKVTPIAASTSRNVALVFSNANGVQNFPAVASLPVITGDHWIGAMLGFNTNSNTTGSWCSALSCSGSSL